MPTFLLIINLKQVFIERRKEEKLWKKTSSLSFVKYSLKGIISRWILHWIWILDSYFAHRDYWHIFFGNLVRFSYKGRLSYKESCNFQVLFLWTNLLWIKKKCLLVGQYLVGPRNNGPRWSARYDGFNRLVDLIN